MMFRTFRSHHLLSLLPLIPDTRAFLSSSGIAPCHHSCGSRSWLPLPATIVPDESSSDATNADNPVPQIKIIECPADQQDMPFYTMGVNLAMQVGNDLSRLLSDREIDLVTQGFGEHLKGTLTKQGLDGTTILQNFGGVANAILQERTNAIVTQNKQAGRDRVQQFQNQHPEAVQTDSGLVYCETKKGTGSSPTLESNIEFHYHGSLTDGTVVDSSKIRGSPQTIPLQQVIPGMREGLLRMKEGTTATILCPSDLAYGDAGAGGVIPGGSTLQFEVELIRVFSNLKVEPVTSS